ncbi:hypothetical protein, variant [Saprolegnia diclina VS20]|uniref:Uncharacterized protein n=1 Tax=Saprolegnia diclina (strain VS20) TaxID=1156394 RepID=T0RTT8_SAPDV|nr:hypothetical protein, variant [Saprolegnia diclina VS20]EQC35943.1 hypothetical protein, variant [Saprolegnia diclina VS20]|eukprot:XP_008610705.1 hypothetical protein, variant [Saprolegnia diclina VS20]
MAYEGDDDCDVHMPPKDFDLCDHEDPTVEETAVLGLSEYRPAEAPRGDAAEHAKTKMEELYLYIQTIEREKEALGHDVAEWKERELKQRAGNVALTKRIEELERALVDTRQQKDVLCQRVFDAQPAMRELDAGHIHVLQSQLEALQTSLDDAERARQSAVFKISELSMGGSPEKSTQDEWMKQFKHDHELLLQRAKLNMAQLQERHVIEMDVALRKLRLEHACAIEKLKLSHEMTLAEWRHDEAQRGKEIESAMEADRHSTRLEIKHHLQHAQIHHQVAIGTRGLLVDAPSPDDELVVRLALDGLRARRLDAVKKLCLIRHAFWRHHLLRRWYTWQHVAGTATYVRTAARRTLSRCVQRRSEEAARAAFQTWRFAASSASQQGLHTAVMQQVLSGERILRWVVARWVSIKVVASYPSRATQSIIQR